MTASRTRSWHRNSPRRCRTSTTVETPDESTAVLQFAAPTPAILDYLLNVQIVTEQDIDLIGERPIGTGPFEFAEWVLNDHITVRKFAEYRQPGLPYLDEIVFRPVLDVDTRLTNLQAGSLDLIEQPAPKDAERIEGDAALQLIVTPPTSKYDNFTINTQNPLMADPKVRQAMSFAFDRESYVRDILYGFGVPAVCPFPATNWAFDAATCDPYLVFDLEKAAQLLEEAGHPGGQGLEGIDIMSPLGYPELKAAAVLSAGEPGGARHCRHRLRTGGRRLDRSPRHSTRLRLEHEHLRVRGRRSIDVLHPRQHQSGD